MNYIDGEQVIIHSLGDEKEYLGIIRGIISKCNDIISYIVEVDIDDEYQYSVRPIPEYCIKPMKKNNWKSLLTKKEMSHLSNTANINSFDDLKELFKNQKELRAITYYKVEPCFKCKSIARKLGFEI
jgi:hypothetical protein